MIPSEMIEKFNRDIIPQNSLFEIQELLYYFIFFLIIAMILMICIIGTLMIIEFIKKSSVYD